MCVNLLLHLVTVFSFPIYLSSFFILLQSLINTTPWTKKPKTKKHWQKWNILGYVCWSSTSPPLSWLGSFDTDIMVPSACVTTNSSLIVSMIFEIYLRFFIKQWQIVPIIIIINKHNDKNTYNTIVPTIELELPPLLFPTYSTCISINFIEHNAFFPVQTIKNSKIYNFAHFQNIPVSHALVVVEILLSIFVGSTDGISDGDDVTIIVW